MVALHRGARDESLYIVLLPLNLPRLCLPSLLPLLIYPEDDHRPTPQTPSSRSLKGRYGRSNTLNEGLATSILSHAQTNKGIIINTHCIALHRVGPCRSRSFGIHLPLHHKIRARAPHRIRSLIIPRSSELIRVLRPLTASSRQFPLLTINQPSSTELISSRNPRLAYGVYTSVYIQPGRIRSGTRNRSRNSHCH